MTVRLVGNVQYFRSWQLCVALRERELSGMSGRISRRGETPDVFNGMICEIALDLQCEGGGNVQAP